MHVCLYTETHMSQTDQVSMKSIKVSMKGMSMGS